MYRHWFVRSSVCAFQSVRRTKRSPLRPVRAGHRLHVETLEPRTLMSATPSTAYLQTNLISDQPGVAAITDASVSNAWGLAIPPTGGNFWISDNHTGVSSVYAGNVNHSALTKALADVTIPGDGPT